MRKNLPIDELNQLKITLRERKRNREGHEYGEYREEVQDAVLSLLVQAFVNGVLDAGDDLGITPTVNTDLMQNVIYRKVAGESFDERVDKYVADDNVENIIRVADTDMQRVYNTSVYEVGRESGATSKQWVTMHDDRVRDTHDYLEGMVVGIDDEFYTYDGDHALHPGGFELAENNVNCRCVIKLKKEKE